MSVVVVGAGISGVACAQKLHRAGVEVRLLDRGHRPGGRMASHAIAGRRVDLGASYLTVSDPAFEAVVADWSERGVARAWTDTFCVIDDGPVREKQGPVRWGAPGGMNALVADLASDLEVEQVTVERLDELSADVVVLAMPDPQARRLLPSEHPLAARLDREFEPVLALAAQFVERTWDGLAPSGHFHGAFVGDDPVLAWVADDGRRRGDDAAVLVAHSTPELARRHLDDPDAAAPAMTSALRTRMDLPEPVAADVHRWSFARPTGEREGRFALVDDGTRLVGVCGDGWGSSPKVETAWLSGRALGQELAARVG